MIDAILKAPVYHGGAAAAEQGGVALRILAGNTDSQGEIVGQGGIPVSVKALVNYEGTECKSRGRWQTSPSMPKSRLGGFRV